MLCPNCSTENAEDAKFCMACGGPMSSTPAAPVPPATPAPEPAGANPWLSAEPAAPVGGTPAPPPPVAEAPVQEAPVQEAPVTASAPPDPAPVVETPQPPAPEPGPPDPFGLAGHLEQMSDATRAHAEVPLLLASLLLTSGESVRVVVPGLIDDIVGVAVVTGDRVLLVNGRRWNPAAYEFRIGPGLVVEGWQEADTAMLTFVAEETVRIAAIVDKPLAFEAARTVRELVAAVTPPGEGHP